MRVISAARLKAAMAISFALPVETARHTSALAPVSVRSTSVGNSCLSVLPMLVRDRRQHAFDFAGCRTQGLRRGRRQCCEHFSASAGICLAY